MKLKIKYDSKFESYKIYIEKLNLKYLKIFILCWICTIVLCISPNLVLNSMITPSYGYGDQIRITEVNDILEDCKIKDPKKTMLAFYLKTNYNELKVAPELIADVILECEEKYNINHDIIIGLIVAESMFKHTSVSVTGCVGYTQVDPVVWSTELIDNKIIEHKGELGIDIRKNVNSGCYVLRKYLDLSNNDLKVALKKYGGYTNKSGFDRYFKKIKVASAEYKDFVVNTSKNL